MALSGFFASFDLHWRERSIKITSTVENSLIDKFNGNCGYVDDHIWTIMNVQKSSTSVGIKEKDELAQALRMELVARQCHPYGNMCVFLYQIVKHMFAFSIVLKGNRCEKCSFSLYQTHQVNFLFIKCIKFNSRYIFQCTQKIQTIAFPKDIRKIMKCAKIYVKLCQNITRA